MGVGKSGDAIEVAKKALDQISGKKSCARDAKETQRDFGVRKGEPIGVAVTIRGEDAIELAKRFFEAKGNQLNGHHLIILVIFHLELREHIDIPGVKYDPTIGILGLDIAVTLTRPGYGIRTRSKHKASVGKTHRITSQEAKDFVSKEFGVTIV